MGIVGIVADKGMNGCQWMGWKMTFYGWWWTSFHQWDKWTHPILLSYLEWTFTPCVGPWGAPTTCPIHLEFCRDMSWLFVSACACGFFLLAISTCIDDQIWYSYGGSLTGVVPHNGLFIVVNWKPPYSWMFFWQASGSTATQNVIDFWCFVVSQFQMDHE